MHLKSDDYFLQKKGDFVVGTFPIIWEESLSKKYSIYSELIVEFLTHIFEQPYEESKRVHNRQSGYNKEYAKMIKKSIRVLQSFIKR